MNEQQEEDQPLTLKKVLEIFKDAQASTWLAGWGGKLKDIIALVSEVGYQFSVVDSSEGLVLGQKLMDAFNLLKDSRDKKKPKLLIYSVPDSEIKPMANSIAFGRESLVENKISLLVLLENQQSYVQLQRSNDLCDKFGFRFDLSKAKT